MSNDSKLPGGYAKLWREAAYRISDKKGLGDVYLQLCARVAISSYTFKSPEHKKTYEVKEGEFFCSQRELCRLLKKDYRTIKRIIGELARLSLIKFQELEDCFVFTCSGITTREPVVELPQDVSVDYHTPPPVPVVELPRTCSNPTTPKEKKKRRKEREEELEEKRESLTPPSLPPKYDSEDLEIAKLWLEYASREMSWSKPHRAWTKMAFAEALAKIRLKTGLNHSGLRAVLNYVSNDAFWVRNALSPASLLTKSKNGARKIDNILSQMKPQSLRQEEKISSWAPLTQDEIDNPF